MAFSNELLDQLLAGCERPEDILGPQGLFAQLKKALADGWRLARIVNDDDLRRYIL